MNDRRVIEDDGSDEGENDDGAPVTQLVGPEHEVPEDWVRALADSADRADLLEVAFRVVDSPFGDLLIASTDVGVVRIAFAVEDHDQVLSRLAEDIGPRIMAAPRRTEQAARQLGEYFERRRRAFDVPVDLQLVGGLFRRSVIAQLVEIPYGTTRSYAAVADAAGRPAAVRAVGSACSHNPVPLVVPCHRVVRSDGSVGQYLGGAEVKAALLAMESAG